MNNKYLYLIPLTLVEVILQLAFFWLAPDVSCYWAVYVFGTVMTLIHIGVTFIIGTTYGTRRSTATIIAGSICQIILVTACGVLLASEASIRNAVFSLLIVSILYAVIVTLFILSIEKDDMLDLHMDNPFDDGNDEYDDELDEEIRLNQSMDNNRHKVHRLARTNSTVPVTQTVGRVNVAVSNGVTPPPLPVRR